MGEIQARDIAVMVQIKAVTKVKYLRAPILVGIEPRKPKINMIPMTKFARLESVCSHEGREERLSPKLIDMSAAE